MYYYLYHLKDRKLGLREFKLFAQDKKPVGGRIKIQAKATCI